MGLSKHIANRFALGQIGLPTTLSKLVKVILNSAVDTGEQLQVTGSAVIDSDPINALHYGTTPPASPRVGKRWLDSNSGITYEYVNDGDSLQWVELCAGPSNTPGAIGKNAIINGAFNIWQRGTAVVSIPDSTYSADRWSYGKSGTGVNDIARSINVPTAAQAGRYFNYSLQVTCTAADVSIAASDVYQVFQPIEGYNWQAFAQRNLTFSFWVRSTKTGIFCVSLRNGGLDRSIVAEYTVNATDTWEKKTVSFAASPSAGTWDYTNGVGAYLSFALANGSNRQTTAGTWNAGNFVSTANQVNGLDSTANIFRMTGVQLEAGDQATEFEGVQYGVEVLRCKRYYIRRSATGGSNQLGIPGYGYATNAQQNYHDRFDVEMRAAPTFTISASADFYVLTNASASAIGLASAKTDPWGAFLVTGNLIAAGVPCSIASQVANAWMAYDAELL